MNRRTILKSTGCDLKRLPLGAREAFFLSQIDGHVSVEEIAEVVGVELDDALSLSEKLIDLGAATVLEPRARPVEARGKAGGGALIERGDSRGSRVDPRAESVSIRPQSLGRQRSLRPGAPVDRRSLRPAAPTTERRSLRPAKTPPPQPVQRPEARRSRKSIRTQAAAAGAQEKAGKPVDDETLAMIAAFEAKLDTLDHYGLFELERDAEKKAIKRAYFRLAATFHPDRFFGKQLGSTRTSVERIFERLTAAHDTLTNAATRAEYDARLPRRRASIERRSSKAIKAASRKLDAVKVEVAPPPRIEPQQTGVVTRRRSSRAIPAAPPVQAAPQPEAISVVLEKSPERMRQLTAAAKEIKVQANIELLVKAAEDALRASDLVTAANNYRLALSFREDPYLREKYEDTDRRGRMVRFEKNIVPARMAERQERWADAAVFFTRAYEARPDAEAAARAGHALRLSGGDLTRAIQLAEHAVALEAKNVAHHITLAEIYVAANRMTSAEAALASALELAPKDTRAKELSAAIAQKAKTSAKAR
jgi:tetratricopeptide (TPR) repeat protein